MLNNQHPMLPTRAAVARALYTNREKGKRSAGCYNIIPQNAKHTHKIQTKKQIESKSSKRITQQIRGAHSCIPEIKWRWERLSFTFQLYRFYLHFHLFHITCVMRCRFICRLVNKTRTIDRIGRFEAGTIVE